MERLDFGSHLDPELGVQVRERFIKQKNLRISDDGAAHRNPLTLTTRERARVAIKQLSQPKNLGCAFDGSLNFCSRFLREHQAERHVLAHFHMRIQRVILEHHRDIALFGLHLVYHGATDANFACADFFKARNHPKQRALATARWANQHGKFAISDLNVDAPDDVG